MWCISQRCDDLAWRKANHKQHFGFDPVDGTTVQGGEHEVAGGVSIQHKDRTMAR
jgi:hypothetical protein